jgi:hypothetical protein
MSGYQFVRGARLRHRFRENQTRSIARQRAMWSEGPTNSAPATLPEFRQVFSTEALLVTAEILKADGPDKAPGIDGVRFGDLCRPELAAICRGLSEAVLGGSYTPSLAIIIQRPKRKGGFREISVRSIAFRIVARRLHDAIGLHVDRQLSGACVGGRPGRGVWDILASLAAAIVTGTTVVAVDDIQGAFDHVQHAAAIEDVRIFVGDTRYSALIERIVHGHPEELRVVGVDQGSAFSTDVLNVHLHRRVDLRILARFPTLFLWRYIDDFIFAVRSIGQAAEVRQAIEHALQAVGLELKPSAGGVDLGDGGVARVLGFIVRLVDGGVRFEIPDCSFDQLSEHLADAWQSSNPPAAASAAAVGWLRSYGPALNGANWDAVVNRILACAAEQGFHEIDRQNLRRSAQSAADRWATFVASKKALIT